MMQEVWIIKNLGKIAQTSKQLIIIRIFAISCLAETNLLSLMSLTFRIILKLEIIRKSFSVRKTFLSISSPLTVFVSHLDNKAFLFFPVFPPFSLLLLTNQ